MRVLVFDDDEEILHVMQKVLHRLDCDVVTFCSAQVFCSRHPQACSCSAQECCADAVLSDVKMPGLSGLELVAHQRQKNCRVRHWALMSGFWTEGHVKQARAMGCRVFHKPMLVEELRNWLSECKADLIPQRRLVQHFNSPTAAGLTNPNS